MYMVPKPSPGEPPVLSAELTLMSEGGRVRESSGELHTVLPC